MKKIIISCLILTSLISCGRYTGARFKSIQDQLILKNNATVAEDAPNFAGNWSGYVEGDLTIMNINSSGLVQITAIGKTVDEKLVKNNSGHFITDTKHNQLLKVEMNGNELNLYNPDGYPYTFSAHEAI